MKVITNKIKKLENDIHKLQLDKSFSERESQARYYTIQAKIKGLNELLFFSDIELFTNKKKTIRNLKKELNRKKALLTSINFRLLSNKNLTYYEIEELEEQIFYLKIRLKNIHINLNQLQQKKNKLPRVYKYKNTKEIRIEQRIAFLVRLISRNENMIRSLPIDSEKRRSLLNNNLKLKGEIEGLKFLLNESTLNKFNKF